MVEQRRVTASDDVELAVYVDAALSAATADAPVVVAVHGYPDDHRVWDRVTALLAPAMTVVRYDVRGAGASGAPSTRAGYRIDQLVADLVSVLDTTAAGRAVHVLAHDWGSVQAWDALTEPRLDGRIASFTSISGPSLDQAGVWVRDVRNHPLASTKQLLRSYYAMAFQVPRLPELAIGAGLIDRTVGPRSRRDQRNGLELYRANAGRLAHPRPRRIEVPVQVIAPREDAFVTPEVATEAPVPFVPDLRTYTVPGPHWIVRTDPEVVADAVATFVHASSARTQRT